MIAAPAKAESFLFSDPLDALLGPQSKETFFERWYGVMPVLLRPINRPSFSPMYRLDDAKTCVQCDPFERPGGRPRYRLVNAGAEVPKTLLESKSDQPVDRWLSVLLQQGWTLTITGVDQKWLPLKCLAEGLAEALLSNVWINCYYTPPSARGFQLHSDPHDVFIWQQTGCKQWQVFAPDGGQEDVPLIDEILGPGELLYIPEGFPHVADTCQDADSFHLTIGFVSRQSQIQQLLLRCFDRWSNDTRSTNTPLEVTEISKTDILNAVERFCAWLVGAPVEESKRQPRTISAARAVQIVRDLDTMNSASRFRHDQSGRGKCIKAPLKGQLRPIWEGLKTLDSFTVPDIPLPTAVAHHFCRALLARGVVDLAA